jgi:hypothetical protein
MQVFAASIDDRLMNLKTRKIPLHDHDATDLKRATPQCHRKFDGAARRIPALNL